MLFLLRMAFWLGVISVLLPGSGTTPPDSSIDTASAVSAASAAVADMRGFCERQPAACDAGGKVAIALGHKVESGARTLINFVAGKIADPATPKAADPTEHEPVKKLRVANPGQDAANGTLTAADLSTRWHAPVPLPPRREAVAGRPAA